MPYGLALERLAERWRSAWLNPAAPAFSECCTADVQYEDPVVREPLEGPAVLAGHAARLRDVFPDLRIEATAPAIGSAGFACLPWRLLGTQKGPLPTLPASDRFLVVHGVHYAELDGERIRRARGFFDLYDVGIQLGLLPARGGIGEATLMLLRGFGLRPRS